MKKIEVYRVLGYLSLAYGVIIYLAHLLHKGLKAGIVLSSPVVLGELTVFALNIFVWAGLILLWRADKNEYPGMKSKWVKFIKIYIIFTVVVIVTALVFPVLKFRIFNYGS